MNNFLRELKRLMDAATKGPWEVGEYSDTLGYDCMTGGIQVGRIYLDGSDYGQSRCEEISVSALDNMQSDAELIAYLVNHAPALAELVETVELLDGSPSDVELAKVLCRRIRAKLNGGKHEG